MTGKVSICVLNGSFAGSNRNIQCFTDKSFKRFVIGVLICSPVTELAFPCHCSGTESVRLHSSLTFKRTHGSYTGMTISPTLIQAGEPFRKHRSGYTLMIRCTRFSEATGQTYPNNDVPVVEGFHNEPYCQHPCMKDNPKKVRVNGIRADYRHHVRSTLTYSRFKSPSCVFTVFTSLTDSQTLLSDHVRCPFVFIAKV